jgi:activator of HSP90 ATPase
MRESRTPTISPRLTRRQALTGVAALGGVIICAKASGQLPAVNDALTSLHQEIDLHATPQRTFEILLSSKDFTAFSGAPADIDSKAGGTFSMFGGMIVGRNIELVPGQRIVQAWRPTDWPPGLYSLVRFELKPSTTGTIVILDHSSFPAGGYDHLSAGWYSHYWEPLKKFLA